MALAALLSVAARPAWSQIKTTTETAAKTETIELLNGDLVTGKVLERTEKHVVLEHPVLGRLEIPIEQIASGSTHPGLLGTSILANWDKEVDLGLTGSRGDTDESDLHVGITLDYADDRRHWQLDGRYEVSYSEGDLDEHDAHATALRDWLWPGARWFAFLYGIYDFDEFEAWKHRTTVGAGPGYHLIESERFTLDTRFGPFFTYEFGEENSARPELAAGLFSKWQIRQAHSLALSNVYLQTLDQLEFRDVTRFEWKIRLAGSRGVSLKIGANNEYDSASQDSKNNLKYYGALSLDL